MSRIPEATYTCHNCGQPSILERDLEERCHFPASQEEPGEFSMACPHCFSDRIEENEIIWCSHCADEQVEDEDVMCMPCRTEHAEMLFDAMMDK